MSAAKQTGTRRPKQKAAPLPGQAPGPGGHTGFPVRGCGCWLCACHRAAEREEAALRRLDERDQHEPMIEGSVTWHPHQVDGRQR